MKISVENVKSSETDTIGEERVKIVKATVLTDDNGLNEFSWDSSPSTINNGHGVNEWSQADLMTELNTLYFNVFFQKNNPHSKIRISERI